MLEYCSTSVTLFPQDLIMRRKVAFVVPERVESFVAYIAMILEFLLM
jgi:hypothetical protein